MTFALSLITALSLATAGALLLYVMRLLAAERERSAARVAALAAAIQPESTHARGPAPLEPVSTSDSFAARPLFSEAVDIQSPGDRRVAAVVTAGGLAILITLVLLGGGRTAPTSAARAPVESDAAVQTGGGAASSGRAGSTPLELLSLRHSREGGSLTISGVIRNPAGASPLASTDVAVFTFDRAGTSVTSVRAPLADRELQGGAESPFSIAIPDGARVNRYRISFRAGSQVLPHVDRRQ